ncbi:MAG: ferrous iron transport protein A [Spirochaetales bacterium]|nr:ferrous iron transport protein A [Spirochaetales bacterium]
MRQNRHHQCCSLEEMTAADLEIGQNAFISSLGKGRGFRAKMLGLGLRPGVSMKIVGGYKSGPRIIEVGRQKFMLGGEMLSAIFIEGEVK